MKMFATERRDKIIDLLQERKRITVKELSSELGFPKLRYVPI